MKYEVKKPIWRMKEDAWRHYEIEINGAEIEGKSEKQIKYAQDLVAKTVSRTVLNEIDRIEGMIRREEGGEKKFCDLVAESSKGSMTTVEQFIVFKIEKGLKILSEKDAGKIITALRGY